MPTHPHCIPQGFGLPPDQLAITFAIVASLHLAALAGAWGLSGLFPSGIPTMAHRVAFLYTATQVRSPPSARRPGFETELPRA